MGKTNASGTSVRISAPGGWIFAGISALTILASPLSPSPAHAASDFERICGSSAPKGELASQRAAYCDSAKLAQRAASDEGKLWKVWAGVAAVCTFSCVSSFLGPASGGVCTGAQLSGAAIDASITRQFATAIQTLAQYSAIQAARSGAKGAAEAAAKKAAKPDFAACASAATAGLQAVSKRQAAQRSRETLQSTLTLAAELDGKAPVQAPPNEWAENGGELPGGGAPTAGRPVFGRPEVGGRKPRPGTGSDEPAGPICNASTSSSGLGIASCAIALDPRLPSFVASPEFENDFKTATGQGLKDFFASRPASGGQALSQLMGAGMEESAASKLGAVVQQLDRAVALRDGADVQSARYLAAGGRAAPGGAGQGVEEIDFNQMFQGILGGFLSGDAEARSETAAARELRLGKFQLRTPASAQDELTQGPSLFERVARRYQAARPRLIEGTQAAQ